MCLSVPPTATAATRMSTSSGPGFGTGQSLMDVPSGPSTGADLTTASMASFECRFRARRESAGAFRNVSQRLLHQSAPPLPPDESQRVIEKLLARSRLVLHHVRRAV